QPFFVVALLFVQLFSFTASAMTLFWGEPPTPLPVDLTMVEATVMVPVSVVEHLGGSVALAGDTVVAQLGGDTLRFTAGQREADLNGTHLLLPAIPTTVEGDL